MNRENVAWPMAVVASLLIFAGLGIYFHERGGFSIFGRKGLIGETLEQAKGTINTLKPALNVNRISSAEIKSILPADEWIVARIKADISVSEKRERTFNTTLSFYTDSLPVTYSYAFFVFSFVWFH